MAETQPMMLQELCYTAADFRLQLASQVCEEGVADVEGGSLLVTTGGSGLDLSVAEGAAFIDSDVDDQGMYSVFNDDAATVTATAANGTDPRIDQVIATVNDSQILGADDNWVLSVLAGTPTAGATLTNLNGAAALPDRSIRLAYVLVPATFTGPFVNATHILDARSNYGTCGGTPYVTLEASAATSSGNAVYAQTTLATVTHLDRAFYSVSGSTVTVLQAGLYEVTANAGFNNIGTAGTTRAAAVLVNNTNLPNAAPDGTMVIGGLADNVARYLPSLSRTAIALAANATIKLALFQNVGSAQNTYHSAANPAFAAHLTVRKVG